MKEYEIEKLSPALRQALDELGKRVRKQFDVEAMYLFGSVVRGEDDSESDADVLIILKEEFSRPLRHRITDAVFEINLAMGTNISSLVVDKANWFSGPLSVLPLKEEIMREGVAV